METSKMDSDFESSIFDEHGISDNKFRWKVFLDGTVFNIPLEVMKLKNIPTVIVQTFGRKFVSLISKSFFHMNQNLSSTGFGKPYS